MHGAAARVGCQPTCRLILSGVPREIPDERFRELFAKVRSHRDQGLFRYQPGRVHRRGVTVADVALTSGRDQR
jgi:hypothetical protein